MFTFRSFRSTMDENCALFWLKWNLVLQQISAASFSYFFQFNVKCRRFERFLFFCAVLFGSFVSSMRKSADSLIKINMKEYKSRRSIDFSPPPKTSDIRWFGSIEMIFELARETFYFLAGVSQFHRSIRINVYALDAANPSIDTRQRERKMGRASDRWS